MLFGFYGKYNLSLQIKYYNVVGVSEKALSLYNRPVYILHCICVKFYNTLQYAEILGVTLQL